jgi:cobalt-zinc-cadmium efflux system membrane fusion protein
MIKKYIIILSVLVLAFCGGGDKAASDHSHPPAPSQETGHQHQGHTPEGETHTHEKGEQEGETHSHGEGEEHEHSHEGEEQTHLDIAPDKQKEWGIVVGYPTLQNVTSQVTLPGVLSLNQNRTAHISTLIHGQVTLLSADLGTRVNKGQALLTINSPDYGQVQADFLNARARLNLSKIEYERAEMLLEKNAIGEREYLRRKAEYEKITTEYGALGSKLHSLGITHDQIDELIAKCDALEDKDYKCEIADPNLPILSPLSGTVIFRDAIVGEHIEPEKVLFTVSNLSTLWALLDAYEKDIPHISISSKVNITSPLYPEKEFPGKITYISNTVDEQLRTVKIRAEVENLEGLLKPNMYIQGIVQNHTDEDMTLVVPETAIQNLEGGKIVFVREGENTFAIRHIKLGEKIGDQRIITEGLNRYDNLVIQGAFTIKSEMTKGTFGHVHVH